MAHDEEVEDLGDLDESDGMCYCCDFGDLPMMSLMVNLGVRFLGRRIPQMKAWIILLHWMWLRRRLRHMWRVSGIFLV
jgi:hypothetical protein